jgi:hypothetical protein
LSSANLDSTFYKLPTLVCQQALVYVDDQEYQVGDNLWQSFEEMKLMVFKVGEPDVRA